MQSVSRATRALRTRTACLVSPRTRSRCGGGRGDGTHIHSPRADSKDPAGCQPRFGCSDLCHGRALLPDHPSVSPDASTIEEGGAETQPPRFRQHGLRGWGAMHRRAAGARARYGRAAPLAAVGSSDKRQYLPALRAGEPASTRWQRGRTACPGVEQTVPADVAARLGCGRHGRRARVGHAAASPPHRRWVSGSPARPGGGSGGTHGGPRGVGATGAAGCDGGSNAGRCGPREAGTPPTGAARRGGGAGDGVTGPTSMTLDGCLPRRGGVHGPGKSTTVPPPCRRRQQQRGADPPPRT